MSIHYDSHLKRASGAPSKPHTLNGSKTHVPRPDLIQALNENMNSALTLIYAPAGFGKSTLLAEWRADLQKQGVSSVQVNLGEIDRDIRQFLKTIALALKRAGCDVEPLTPVLGANIDEASSEAAASKIIEAARSLPSRAVMIIDDYHFAQSQAADALLAALLSRRKDGAHMVVSGRRRPQINIGHLLALNEAREINAADLKFSIEETLAAFGCSAGDALEDAVLRALDQRIGGWPVAVQFAKMSSAHKKHVSKAAAGLRGHRGPLADYFSNQVMPPLTSEQQDFLLKTSILEAFNAELADAVLGCFASDRLMKELEPLQGLVALTDGEDGRFRLHTLFSEYLQDLSRIQFGQEVKELRVKAAHWLFDHACLAEAVRQAGKAGRYDLCTAFIEDAGGWKLGLHHGAGFLSELLSNMPKRKIEEHPSLLFAACCVAVRKGEIVEGRGYYERAVSELPLDESDSEEAGGRIAAEMLLALYGDDLERFEAIATKAAVQSRHAFEDLMVSGVAQAGWALRHVAQGRFEASTKEAYRAMRSFREGGARVGAAYAYLKAGVANFYAGRCYAAEGNFKDASEIIQREKGADDGLALAASCCSGALQYWKSGFDEDASAEFVAVLRRCAKTGGWFDIYAIALDAAFSSLTERARFNEAAETIQAVRKVAAAREASRLDRLCAAYELQLSVRREDLSAAYGDHRRLQAQRDRNGAAAAPSIWLADITDAFSCADYMAKVQDYPAALSHINKALETAAGLGARFHEARILIAKAAILRMEGRALEMRRSLTRALEIGAGNHMMQPFLLRQSEPLMRELDAIIGKKDASSATLRDFVRELLRKNASHATLLTARERQVLTEVVRGHTNKEVARALDMKEATVKFHLKKVFAKLGVKRRTQAVGKARDLGLV